MSFSVILMYLSMAHGTFISRFIRSTLHSPTCRPGRDLTRGRFLINNPAFPANLLTSVPLTTRQMLMVTYQHHQTRDAMGFVTPWTVAHQAPLSMGFPRQERWSGLPCPPPRELPDPGVEPASLLSPALAGRFFTTSAP